MSVVEPEKVLTAVGAARLLGCSRQRVAAPCESGELSAYQMRARGPWNICTSAVLATPGAPGG